MQYITKIGLLMITSHCFVSGLAGVYTEVVFKKDIKVSWFDMLRGHSRRMGKN